MQLIVADAKATYSERYGGMQVSEDRAVFVHRIAPKYLKTAIRGENDPSSETFMHEVRDDAHRHHYGWYRGLRERGYDAYLLDRPSYLVPYSLLNRNPDRYLRLLSLVHGTFSPLRPVDGLLYYLHLALLIITFRPTFVLFLLDELPEPLNRLCDALDVTTITDFGDVPSSKPLRVRAQARQYDIVTAGFELPALWPAISNSFYRIMPGPSRVSQFVTGPSRKANIDVCVIGGFGGIFEERARLIEGLLQRTANDDIEVNVYGYEYGVGLGSKLLKRVVDLTGDKRVTIPFEGYEYNKGIEDEYPRLAAALRGPVYGQAFYEAIDRSKVVVTIPNDPQIDIESIRPMGIFEPAAAETFQVTLDNADARATFEAGEEVAFFEDIDDLYEVIRYYLDHADERERLAANAHERFLEEYAAEVQISKLVDDLKL